MNDIALIVGVDKKTVRNDLKKMNVPSRSVGVLHPVRDAITYEQMVQLRRARTMAQIADEFGISLRLTEQIWTDLRRAKETSLPNVLTSRWVPVIDFDGDEHIISIPEIAQDKWRALNTGNVVTDMAVRLFLIGVMQTLVSSVSQWSALTEQSLSKYLARYSDAFYLNGDGPRFLQAQTSANKLRAIQELLPYTPTGNTLARNADIFNKRGPRQRWDVSETIIGLITAQQFSNFRGRGHYSNHTANKVFAYKQTERLWESLWLSVNGTTSATFPWVDESMDNPWWMMPLKIRLVWEDQQCIGFYMEPHGLDYGEIAHPMVLGSTDKLTAHEDNLQMEVKIVEALDEHETEHLRVFGIHWQQNKMLGVFDRALHQLNYFDWIVRAKKYLYVATSRALYQRPVPHPVNRWEWVSRVSVPKHGELFAQLERNLLHQLSRGDLSVKEMASATLQLFDVHVQGSDPKAQSLARAELSSSLFRNV